MKKGAIMPAMTDLLVKDDAASPVEYTLKPVTDTPNPLWRASVSGTPLDGQIRLTEMVDELKNGSYKVSVKLEVPVMETLGASGTAAGYVAPPKVAYVTTAIFSMFVDKRSTSQNRSDCLKMIVGLLQGASSTTATGVLNQASAGSAFANSVLPITQSIVSVIKPN